MSVQPTQWYAGARAWIANTVGEDEAGQACFAHEVAFWSARAGARAAAVEAHAGYSTTTVKLQGMTTQDDEQLECYRTARLAGRLPPLAPKLAHLATLLRGEGAAGKGLPAWMLSTFAALAADE